MVDRTSVLGGVRIVNVTRAAAGAEGTGSTARSFSFDNAASYDEIRQRLMAALGAATDIGDTNASGA